MILAAGLTSLVLLNDSFNFHFYHEMPVWEGECVDKGIQGKLGPRSLQSKIFPSKFSFFILEKGILAGKNYFAKKVIGLYDTLSRRNLITLNFAV
jgi:hypothetical protein